MTQLADTIRIFEEKRFLDLTREDAISLGNLIDSENGSKPGHVLHKTEKSVDQSVVAKHPWFLPYVLATEYVDRIPFSSEIAKYLVDHPVVPADLKFNVTDPRPIPERLAVDKKGDVSELAAMAKETHETTVSASDELVAVDNKHKARVAKKAPVEAPTGIKVDTPNPTASPAPEKPVDPVRRRSSAKKLEGQNDETKYQKTAQCFFIVMECVAKCSTSIPDYFDTVVLSHIFHRNEAAKKLLINRKPGSMDESLFALAALDDGKTLYTIGLDMISSVVRIASGKYGRRVVDSIINQSIRPSGAKTLTDAYMLSFPRYPATLSMMLKSLKAGIMDLKK